MADDEGLGGASKGPPTLLVVAFPSGLLGASEGLNLRIAKHRERQRPQQVNAIGLQGSQASAQVIRQIFGDHLGAVHPTWFFCKNSSCADFKCASG